MNAEKMIEFAKRYYEDISHPMAVARNFEELSDEWVVALFHDILEDTNIDKQELLSFLTTCGKDKLYEEIVKITRKNDETYFDYIRRLKRDNSVAMVVKIADLKHNLSRKDTLKPSLKERYEKALKILCDA